MRILSAVVLATALASLAAVATGCGTDSAPEPLPPAAIDERNAASLRGATDVEGSLPASSALTLEYTRKPEYAHVPYLAAEILPDADAVAVTGDSFQQITVDGMFPSAPRVFVVDAEYNVLETVTTTQRRDDGSTLAVVFAPRRGERTVIVHDPLWSLPMSFEIRVGK
jgi:hypothetical protein